MAHASSIGLADWCVNLNGDINTACNGAGSGGMSTNPDGGSIILTSFSQLAEPTVNTLGSVVINLGAGTNQSVAFYADYDVDYPTLGAFLDSGTVHGPVPASYSYELSDPNTSNIFAGFQGRRSRTPIPSARHPDPRRLVATSLLPLRWPVSMWCPAGREQ